jgi:alcohol dehydrogenase (cytochrome c)
MTNDHNALRVSVVGVLAAGAVAFGLPAYGQSVTNQRLLNADAEPENWLLPYGNYSNHMNSGLSEINRSNVGDLRVKFMVSIGGYEPTGTSYPSQQQIPLVNNGILWVNTAWSQVLKVDVSSGNRGEVLWIVDPEEEMGRRKRGLALLGDYVYDATIFSRLLKIDAASGEVVYDVNVMAPEPSPQDQQNSAAPLAINDKIFLGNSSGGGKRGHIHAFSAEDGSLVWRFFTIPGPGEPGHETWADDHNAWQTGGAAVWNTPAYDPETNLVFYGTGDAAPWGDPMFRPGDNLYTVSSLALDADTGKLVWYFQEVPNESWDYDTVNPRMLYDIIVNGEPRKVVGNFARTGFFYTLDRTTGEFLFAKPYTEVTWTAGLDPKTGKAVEYDPSVLVQDYGGKSLRLNRPDTAQNVCPMYNTGPTMHPPVFDAGRMVAYTSGGEDCMNMILNVAGDPVGHGWGKDVADWDNPSVSGAPTGHITAVDVQTGETAAKVTFQYPLYSGLLGTAGDLLFIGHQDGRFAAYDKDTLDELWSFETGTPINAPPISYSVGGRQYIAVVTGGQRRNDNFYPALGLIQRNANLVVFGL